MMTENSLKILVANVLRIGDYTHTTHNLRNLKRDPEYAHVEDWMLTLAAETQLVGTDLLRYLATQVFWTLVNRPLTEQQYDICLGLLSELHTRI